MMDKSNKNSETKIDMSAQPALKGTISQQLQEEQLKLVEQQHTQESPVFGPRRTVSSQPLGSLDLYSTKSQANKELGISARVGTAQQDTFQTLGPPLEITKAVSYEMPLPNSFKFDSQVKSLHASQKQASQLPSGESQGIHSLSKKDSEQRSGSDNTSKSQVRDKLLPSLEMEEVAKQESDAESQLKPHQEDVLSPFGGKRPHTFSFGATKSFGISVIQSVDEQPDNLNKDDKPAPDQLDVDTIGQDATKTPRLDSNLISSQLED